jgi:hypothetical protein
MKKWILVLLCCALARTVQAQAPEQVPPPAPAPTPGAMVADVGCCVPTKTVCVPVASTKVKVTINYSSKCEKICYPACTICGLKLGGCADGSCGGCPDGNCGHPYQKKYLVKKIVTTEEPRTKCVPVEVPVCAASCQHGFILQTGPTAPPVEIVPPPMKK